MNTSLTIFVPTTGRDTLPAVLKTLECQEWRNGDEVFLLSDANHEYSYDCWCRVRLPGKFFACGDGPLGYWGYGLLNRYGDHANATHVCHVRDDVLVSPDMVKRLRNETTQLPSHLHMFRMYDFEKKELLWKSENIAEGEVTGENAIFPNDPRLVGKWGLRHLGDYDFIKTANGFFDVAWHNSVVLFHNPPWINHG